MATKKPTPSKETAAKDLHAKLTSLRKDLSDAKRSLSANELPNPRVVKNTRREIARTLTAINQERTQKEQNNA